MPAARHATVDGWYCPAVSLRPPARIALTALAVATAALIGAAPAPAPAPHGQQSRATCHGLPVTTTADRGEITGTARRDVIRLNAAGHVRSGAGDDVICGSRFADRIEAGAGHDVVLAGAGHDLVRGGVGSDVLMGEAGHDHLEGGLGGDTLMGGPGNDRIVRERAARGPHGSARETGIWPPFTDIVVPGNNAVSIITDSQSLSQIWAGQGSFVFDWLPIGTLPQVPPGVTLAWQVIRQPTPATLVPVPDDWSVFVSGPVPPPIPGQQLAGFGQFQYSNTTWGAGWAVGPDNLLGPQGSAPNGDSVSVMNNSMQTVLTGLALGNVPVLGAPTAPNMANVYRRTSSLRVRAWWSGFVTPAQLLPAVAPDTQSTTVEVRFKGGGVVPLRYSTTGGFIQG